jgi:hypothetical protein
MHPSAYAWATSALSPGDVKGKHIAEAGATDVNGSVRGHIEAMHPASYTGTDISEGPSVDRVLDAADYSRLKTTPDVIISTEMLEHAEDWQAAMAGMIRALAPGGLLVITTRSEGFPYHGYPGDHWRFSVEAMREIMTAARLEILDLQADPDPGSPGVFVKAAKPPEWAWPRTTRKAWAAVAGVTVMTG